MLIGIDFSRATKSEKTGTENYSYHLTKELVSLDKHNKFRLYCKNTPDFPFLKNPSVQVKQIKLPRLWTQVGLALECLINPPDILFIPAHTMPVLRRPDLKTIVTIHDLGAEFLPQYHQFPQKLYLNSSTEYAVSHATHLIAVSDSTKKDLINTLHCDAEKISVIYESYDNSIFKRVEDQEKLQAVKNKYNLSGDFVLFVGTIQPRKNLERAIKAFAKAKTQNNLPHKFILVGKSGWLNEELYKLPEKLGLKNDIVFLGYVPNDDLPSLYSLATAFLFPSLFEGFGIPLLEAMACGCPVVTSDTSSMPEVVGDSALQIDPQKEEKITDALTDLLTDEEKRKFYIQKGLVRVKQFSWSKTASETQQLIEKVALK